MGRIKRIIITIAVGFTVAFAYICIIGFFSAENLSDKLKYACDGFFFAGIILFCVGVLSLCKNEGTFDMLGFSMKKFTSVFLPFKRLKEIKGKTFLEYREERMSRIKPFLHLILGGLFHILVAAVLLIFYYNTI